MKKITLLLTTLSLLLISQASSYEFCDDGQVGDDIRIISFDDMLKENAKEWIWEPEESVELEIRVQNRGESSNEFIAEITAIDSDEDEVDLARNSDDLKKEFALKPDERQSIVFEFELDEDLKTDEYFLFIKVYERGEEDNECTENSEVTIKVEKIDFCPDGSVGRNDLEIKEIKDQENENEEEWLWKPSEEIDIEVILENKDFEETNFEIELIMLDENNNRVEFADKEDTLGSQRLDENEEDEIEFRFTLSSTLTEGKYSFYAIAYDEDDDEICTTQEAESKNNQKFVTIERLKRKIVLSDLIVQSEANQGEDVTFQLKASNIGTKDEDKVSITMYNRVLGITENTIIDNLDSGEEQVVNLTTQIPNNASLEEYKIQFYAKYEYKESSGYYRSETKEDDEVSTYLLILKGDTEEEVIKKEPENISENLTFENEIDEDLNSLITGNVISQEKSNSGSLLLFILLGLLATAGLTFLIIKNPGLLKFSKKPKVPHVPKTTEPNIIRTYKARL